MRLALQRLLANPSALSLLRSAVHSDGAGFCQHCSHSTPTRGRSRRYATKEHGRGQIIESRSRVLRIRKFLAITKDDRHAKGHVERNRPDIPKSHARLPNAPGFESVEEGALPRSAVLPDLQVVPVTQHDLHSGNLSSEIQSRLPIKDQRNYESWRSCLVTFEQYEYESNLEAPAVQGPRLVDDPSHTGDWGLWLELIVFQRRHYGTKGTKRIFKEIFRRDLRLPTCGILADQLWDLLLRAGFYDFGLLEEIVTYAMFLKRSTGASWLGIYNGVVSIALKKDPASVHHWHSKLRDNFPPSLRDYKKLFRLSIVCGRPAFFRALYKDTPLVGMYRTVIWHLCNLQLFAKALEWHDLLYDAKDFPTSFTDIKPLLDHLAYIGDAPRLEKIVRALTENKIGFSEVAEDLVQRDVTLSREILNRQLGEVHGVRPKHLSDHFCARLFATRLFSVDTVIGGLQMMGAEAIGPLSLREIAARDHCDPVAICHHTDALKTAGISLDNSAFCSLVRSLATENKRGILKSIVDCDLHPDTFADFDLQERLLAQYAEESDLTKVERTLAILTAGRSEKNLQMVQLNLILRCQVTLGRSEKVLATLEELKRAGLPVTARSSRHLRVYWLSRRQVGRRGAGQMHELNTIIQAAQRTMQCGHFVPVIAWREILRRLGMAGRLMDFENLALWLVDWYSSPAAKAAYPKRILPSSHGSPALIEYDLSQGKQLNRDPHRFLSALFTTSAKHAIVAWGFQKLLRLHRSTRKVTMGPTVEKNPRTRWTWGLHLLYKLRERGVNIKRGQVARICRHRLNILFGAGISKRKINRRMKLEPGAREPYTESVYIQKMEEIWGKGLFPVWRDVGKGVETRMGRKPGKARLGKNGYRTRNDPLEVV